ncbi:MAG: ADP-ribose pyrophosphatase [Rhizobacter sp.]|nr:ADP-ribose pyrophosphatase [Rhizobacter sp.]
MSSLPDFPDSRPAAIDEDDHPQLVEHRVSSQQMYRGHFLDVRRDEVKLPDGGTAHREYIIHPGAVMVVPVLDDGRLVVERQHRYPMNRVMLEFPAGKLDKGEATLHCGIRELAEETGYRGTEWAYAGVLHNAIAYSTEGIHIWFARGLTLGEVGLDEGEFVDVSTITVDELAAMVLSGEVTDAKTIIGLMWLEKWKSGAWKPDWQLHPSAS